MLAGILFRLWLYTGTFILGLLGLPLLLWSVIRGRDLPSWLPAFWVRVCLFGLKLCGVNIAYRGLHNIPEGAVIIASKHESALETLVYYLLLSRPAYVLKRELYYLPIFGWYLAVSGMLAINRKKPFRALLSVLTKADQILQQERKLVIFPEGTRTPKGQSRPYNKGVYELYRRGYVVIPASLNSGKFWRKGRLRIDSGTAIFSFLPAIESGLATNEFMRRLRQAIEQEATKL